MNKAFWEALSVGLLAGAVTAAFIYWANRRWWIMPPDGGVVPHQEIGHQSPHQWWNHNTGSQIHTVPLNDLREHDHSQHCWCQPDWEPAANCDLFIHNSADGREAYETGRRKPH